MQSNALTQFLYIRGQFGIAKEERKYRRFKDFETLGRKVSKCNPFKYACVVVSV